jgi:hypothetical protein
MQHSPNRSRSARNRGHDAVKRRSRFGEITGHDDAKYAGIRGGYKQENKGAMGLVGASNMVQFFRRACRLGRDLGRAARRMALPE